MAGIAELGLLARALAGQAGLGIGGRLVGAVGAPLAVKADAGIARIVGWGVPARIIFALEARVSRPFLTGQEFRRPSLVLPLEKIVDALSFQEVDDLYEVEPN